MNRSESFPERMSRLFYNVEHRPLGVNSYHSKTITFQVTEDCNLRCSYCYQGAKTKRRMSLETAKAIIDMLLAADDRSCKYITSTKLSGVAFDFIGGEPFLEVELIDKIMDYFVERAFALQHPLAYRYMISISSNGTLYFRPEVQRFIKKWHRHLSLSISVDGNKRLHDACRVFPDGSGSYDIAIAAARDYMARYGEIGSKMTISPDNVQYLAEAVRELIGNGYREIFLNCVYEEGWTAEHARTLYNQLRALADELATMDTPPVLSIFQPYIGRPMDASDNQNWCGGTGCMLAFDADGRAYPCLRYMESSLAGAQLPFVIGDLANGIMNTPEHEQRVRLLEGITRRSQSSDECWNCPIASGCSWCSAYNYQVYGTPDKRATFICIMHKARVLANVYYWNLRRRHDPTVPVFPLNVPEEWAVPIIGETEYETLKAMTEVMCNGSG